MFTSDDQTKLAAVLSKTFDAYTLASQFNAVAEALESDTLRSDHQDALLKGYRQTLQAVAEQQCLNAKGLANNRRLIENDMNTTLDTVKGILVVIPSAQKCGRGGTPAPTTVIKTAQGDITLHISGAKPFDLTTRPDRLFAAIKNRKVVARGFLWANEAGVHMTLAKAGDLKRVTPANPKPSRKA